MYTFYLHQKDYVLEAAIFMWYFSISFIQSSVTLKNGCKKLCYFFPNEIKNSAHQHDTTSRLIEYQPKSNKKYMLFYNVFQVLKVLLGKVQPPDLLH